MQAEVYTLLHCYLGAKMYMYRAQKKLGAFAIVKARTCKRSGQNKIKLFLCAIDQI